MINMQKNPGTTIDSRLSQITDCLYRVASKAIIIRNNKILLVKEKEGFYGLPGGGVDYGQTPCESLIREIDEEIGFLLKLEQINPKPLFFITEGLPTKHIPRASIYYKISVNSSFIPKSNELSFIWANKDEFSKISLGPTNEYVRDKITNLL